MTNEREVLTPPAQVLAHTAELLALENLELRGAIVRRSAERDQAEARTDQLESAIHTLVHDLRSPLGAIRGYAELLEDDIDADPERAHEFVRTIIASGDRMATQIDRMLALYHITNQPIEPDVVDLSSMGRELADELAMQFGDREVHVHVEDDMLALVDPVLSRLLLENLMGNAFKYTGRKHRAHIEVARLEHGLPMSTFVVSDNGDGFPQEHAHRLFQPLSRLHSPAEFPGTGLGLASVARIVDLHGGHIRAEGAKGEGASFIFSLPVPA